MGPTIPSPPPSERTTSFEVDETWPPEETRTDPDLWRIDDADLDEA